MQIHEAVFHFARRLPAERSTFDCDCSVNGHDLWPEGAAAAVSLAGMLDDAQDDAGLDAGLEHFKALAGAGIVTEAELQVEIQAAMAAVIAEGRRREMATAAN